MTELLPSATVATRPSVRRCLWPADRTKDDGFMRQMEKVDRAAAARFKHKWNIDIYNDGDGDTNTGNRTTTTTTHMWIKANSESDIPDFYKRGYTHKCKRRALTPCVGKSLSFGDSEESWSNNRSQSPVQYLDPTTVDVFIGTRLSVTDRRPQTPEPDTPNTTDSEEEEDSENGFTPVRMSASLSQTRLTDVWPIRKRGRAPDDLPHSKRERLSSL